jgi:SPP1 family phage portal protein
MILKGREKIVTEFNSEDLKDFENLRTLLNTSRATHLENKADIDYLIAYRNGIQPVLLKEKVVRDEINNKVVINHAQMVTRNVIGYFLGNPIQYIQAGANGKDEIDLLNKYVAYEDKYSVDKEIGEFQSICGTAFRIIYTDGVYGDEVPFEDKALNPASTYVVYENNIAERPIIGVTYYTLLNDEGEVKGTKVYAYTDFGLYEVEVDTDGLVITPDDVQFSPYNVGGVPIIEYPNNMWRIGDWELCIGLMDAINSLQSGRLDDIDQVIQSLLVFVNADIDVDGYDEMRERGVVLLKNNSGNPSSVDSITNTLDQSGMNQFSQELEALLYALIGIPDRNSRSGGGGDTGQAVELRDGWADLEILARNKELIYKRSEKMALRIILKIMNNKESMDLSLMDIDIKFTRNKNNNLMIKCTSYSTLLATKTLSPADCLTIVDLVSDVNEYIARGEVFWGDGFAGQIENNNRVEMSNVQLETAKNPPEQVEGEVVQPVAPVKSEKKILESKVQGGK